jgi:hypothetical protein
MQEQPVSAGPPWWWCLDHAAVEGPEGCANTVRLGPFEQHADAERALELAQERTEAWDHDPVWNDEVEREG